MIERIAELVEDARKRGHLYVQFVLVRRPPRGAASGVSRIRLLPGLHARYLGEGARAGTIVVDLDIADFVQWQALRARTEHPL